MAEHPITPDPGTPPPVIDTRGGPSQAATEPTNDHGQPNRRKLLAAGVAGAVLSLAAVSGVAFAGHSSTASASGAKASATTTATQAPADRQRLGGGGTVTKIDGTTLTVEAKKRHGRPGRCAPQSDTSSKGSDTESKSTDNETVSLTIRTSASTTFTEFATGSISDLATGDDVAVMGETSGTTVAAKRIIQKPDSAAGEQPGAQGPDADSNGEKPADRDEAHRRRPRPVHGTITAVQGGKLTLKTSDGKTITVTTDQDTKVTVAKKASLEDIEVGDRIGARGTVDGTTVSATSVVIGMPPRPGNHPGPRQPDANSSNPQPGGGPEQNGPPTTA